VCSLWVTSSIYAFKDLYSTDKRFTTAECSYCYIAVYIIFRSISNDRINVLFIKYDNNVKIQTSECSALYSQTTSGEHVIVMHTYWLVMVPF